MEFVLKQVAMFFQLHISNTIGMNERAFITETNDSWRKGEYIMGLI